MTPPLAPTRRLAIALLAASLAAPAAAQTVRGRVVEADDAPVASVVVVLQDERGERIRATLADPDGRFGVRVPAPGRYRLSAERAGYATAAPLGVEVPAEGLTGVVLRAESRRIVLPAVTAQGRRRACDGDLAGGAGTAVLWEEARKALEAAALGEEEGRYRFRSLLERTHTMLGGREIGIPRRWEAESTGLPFTTLSGEELTRGGYMAVHRDSIVLFGLGAAAILSEAFLTTHCFGVREGGSEHPGLVGLEFVPLAGRVEPDVRGVLWLDRVSGELRFVDYRYANLPFAGRPANLGGRLDFRRLPGGGWVVWEWTIRAPRLSYSKASMTRETLGRYRVAGFDVTSGRVLDVSHADGTPLEQPAAGEP